MAAVEPVVAAPVLPVEETVDRAAASAVVAVAVEGTQSETQVAEVEPVAVVRPELVDRNFHYLVARLLTHSL